jgi:hypothetical protein
MVPGPGMADAKDRRTHSICECGDYPRGVSLDVPMEGLDKEIEITEEMISAGIAQLIRHFGGKHDRAIGGDTKAVSDVFRAMLRASHLSSR